MTFREALRRHLARLAAERDSAAWGRVPLAAAESGLQKISDWGRTEDWSAWDVDAAGEKHVELEG